MDKSIILFGLITFTLLSMTIISAFDFNPYYFNGDYKIYITGNESKIVSSVVIIKDEVTIEWKSLIDRTYNECEEEVSKDIKLGTIEVCKNVTYNIPESMPVKDKNDLTTISLSTRTVLGNSKPIVYKIPTGTDYLKIGYESIIIIADTSINSNLINVTAENQFTHLNFNTVEPYSFDVAYTNGSFGAEQVTNGDFSVPGGAPWTATAKWTLFPTAVCSPLPCKTQCSNSSGGLYINVSSC